MNADFIDDEDLEKKVLPYIIQHSTPDDHSASTNIPHAAYDASYDEEAEDAAWFKLFALLERYGSPGMLESAFATPPTKPSSDGI